MATKIKLHGKGQFFIIIAVFVVSILYLVSLYTTQISPSTGPDINNIQVYSDYKNIKNEIKEVVMNSLITNNTNLTYAFVNFSMYYMQTKGEHLTFGYTRNQFGVIESYNNQSDWWNSTYAKRLQVKVINNRSDTYDYNAEGLVNENGEYNLGSVSIAGNSGERFWNYSNTDPIMPSPQGFLVTNETFLMQMELNAEGISIIDSFYA